MEAIFHHATNLHIACRGMFALGVFARSSLSFPRFFVLEAFLRQMSTFPHKHHMSTDKRAARICLDTFMFCAEIVGATGFRCLHSTDCRQSLNYNNSALLRFLGVFCSLLSSFLQTNRCCVMCIYDIRRTPNVQVFLHVNSM